MMRTTSAVLVCLAACTALPFKKKNTAGVGTQTRQRLFYHWPIGKLTEAFSFVIADTATPDVARRMSMGREGEEIYTEPNGVFHWESEQARFVPGQKMSRATRMSF